MERKIGEIFTDGDVTLEVERWIDSDDCRKCHYKKICGCENNFQTSGECLDYLRDDNEQVIFIKHQPNEP